jgi:hypothetical protein
MSRFFTKDPGEVIVYTIDYANELASGDTISTTAWVLETGITNDSDTNTTTTTSITISGGTADTSYRAENTVVTAAGETIVDAIYIQIANV